MRVPGTLAALLKQVAASPVPISEFEYDPTSKRLRVAFEHGAPRVKEPPTAAQAQAAAARRAAADRKSDVASLDDPPPREFRDA